MDTQTVPAATLGLVLCLAALGLLILTALVESRTRRPVRAGRSRRLNSWLR